MPVEQPFTYGEWFDPPAVTPLHPVTREAEDYLFSRSIQQHEFFRIAAQSPDALRLWVTQELVVTGEFAKQLHLVAGRINNTHLRAMTDLVTAGENGAVNPEGVAQNSHPTLLDALRESMDISRDEVVPLPETLDFLRVLEEECMTPLRGVAALGVGNEKMIPEEYEAVMRSFEACLPDARFRAFLMANIVEDSQHASLLARVGTGLINQGHDPALYLTGAKAAVDSRFEYYDRILQRIR